MPGWVLEAVVAHELAHVFHPDHSPAFWELLGRACPETGRAEAFLAGASWYARNIDVMPPVERELLSTGEADEVRKPPPVPVDVARDTRPDAIDGDGEV